MEKRRNLAKKPERGSFILDHNNDCTLIKNQYLKCLKANNNDHIFCRNFSKEYFICRMENNLLEKQSLENLGFFENEMNDIQYNNRMDGFKDVYSYNMYNERMELLSKKKQVPNIYSEVNVNTNVNDIKEKNIKEINNKEINNKETNIKENNNKETNNKEINIIEKEKEKDKIKIGEYLYDNHYFRESKEIEETNVSKEQKGDMFLLLNIHQKENTPLFSINSNTENVKRNKDEKKNKDQKKKEKQKKIEIKRKEVDGYLAGKEYIKALADRKKKNKIGDFINSFFKERNQGENDIR